MDLNSIYIYFDAYDYLYVDNTTFMENFEILFFIIKRVERQACSLVAIIIF